MKIQYIMSTAAIFLFIGYAEAGLARPADQGLHTMEGMQQQDSDLYALIARLEQHMPITADVANRLGFMFDSHTDSRYGPTYAGSDAIPLNDGVIINGTKLAQLHTSGKSGAMFVLMLGGKEIHRSDIEERYDDLETVPSAQAPLTAAVRQVDAYQIRLCFDKHTILREIVFDSTKKREP